MSGPYADPRVVTDPDDCYFYHTMGIPGHGVVEGQWDLRTNVEAYAGGVDYSKKRVLEVGTASGFLCFWMEQQGAEVVAYDLSEAQAWDVVPYASVPGDVFAADRRAIMRKINNGWWFAHRAFGSHARVVYGTVYEIPETIGAVDIATYCSVLLHVRDPFQALYRGSLLTAETMVVTDLIGPKGGAPPAGLHPETGRPQMQFIPDFTTASPPETWWFLSPEIVQAFLGVLGFGDATVSRHVQGGVLGDYDLFTVVAHRTAGRPIGS
jgi:hypothetical protein